MGGWVKDALLCVSVCLSDYTLFLPPSFLRVSRSPVLIGTSLAHSGGRATCHDRNGSRALVATVFGHFDSGHCTDTIRNTNTHINNILEKKFNSTLLFSQTDLFCLVWEKQQAEWAQHCACDDPHSAGRCVGCTTRQHCDRACRSS